MTRQGPPQKQFRPEAHVLETELGNGWMVIERFTMQEGRYVVAQLVICAAPPQTPVVDGRNAGEPPPDGVVPPGGVTARLLRTIKVGQVDEVVNDYREWVGRHFGEESVVRLDKHVPPSSRRRRRQPPKTMRNPDAFYAWLARDYVEALKGRNPTSTLARLRGVTVSEMRTQIYLARANGFLSETTPGRAGGALTPKASKILAIK